jgi:nucleotide-binding universal stress UspA family protein
MYERILVGTDGSDTAGKAVQRAVDLAKATGATLTIVTAGADAGGTSGKQLLDDVAAAHRASGVAIDTKVLAGDPASALVEEAEANGYDLLVVGNRGMAGASRFLLGSVPNKVSHHAPCALLIVHTT